ncbi:lambda-crystallin homolog [Rhopalosiphum maidis]|uniref:lambda-crystallin homolog n=1 Tax=Rhopalosiphum maidis TaxID=43146 RepID=UPI000EFF64F0|nr:lambda-crystallin homolog [Rhopalosiphum maidis]XP_026817905.1 lambda-crystallin homolog [Rhopalosiphum maidis]XP_060833415.1 lambda-crystallin homolog [Rhopalosiphum padi]XP_060833416.1 lambda-crystallin homolog [Rhopalosiphum padi]XP_060833417.1 lambda-crystallin homolog [Rhopalosiphum padi]
MAEKGKIGIIGSGLIGQSWAMLFASARYNVIIYDINLELVNTAYEKIKSELKTMEKNGILRGNLTAEQQIELIKGVTKLEEVVEDTILIQECIPEVLSLKQQLYDQIDKLIGSQTIISSSTSTFLPSVLSEKMKHRNQLIVSHPVNPPYFVPLVEIVPSEWTEEWVIKKTRTIMEDIKQSPVTLAKEVPGFALNRIQYAILNECWHLVNDGVLNVKDVDTVMSEGLGMRYAFLGPLETAHLNAEGFVNYTERYSNSMYGVCQQFKPSPKFEGPLVKVIGDQLNSNTPLEDLPKRRLWRDQSLIKLSQLKKYNNY